jgi:dihydropteroate synthase
VLGDGTPEASGDSEATAGSNNRAFELVSIVMRERIWKIGERVLNVSRRGLIMGVLNVTPDSFSDGGKFFALENAIEHGVIMASEGADIIDVGGESTRPGAEPIGADEELRRVIPVIDQLRSKIDVPISIDTSKAEVARAAIQAGASIVNDVTAGRGDEGMLPLVAETNSALIIMHMQGTPKTMQNQPRYSDVVSEIADFFLQQYARSIGYNIDPMAIAFDPGIGFGKTLEHNLQVLAQLEQLRTHDRPLVVGVSRKSFLGKVVDSRDLEDRLAPAVALTSLLRARGADVLRVHDVRENTGALRITEAILRRAG